MTSTNDGQNVNSNRTSGQKGKLYYIELYHTLDGRLSGEGKLQERTQHLCEAWRRIHILCRHSASTTHTHLLSWLQRHTARTILQTEWQAPESKDEHTKLSAAIDAYIEESQGAIVRRDGSSPLWEHQLMQRAEWFKSILSNPWGHPVLRVLLDPRGEKPTDKEVIEWLKEERGVMFVTRLRQLAASKCDDLATVLVAAVMDRVRASIEVPKDGDVVDSKKDKSESKEPTFADILKTEAGFTVDVWEFLTDLEFVLLYKGENRSRCIELAKQAPLRSGYQLVERLQSRLKASPRDKKLWKNAKEVATLIAQVVIARCMVVPVCTGAAWSALYCCTRSLVRLLPAARLPAAASALAAPAATARHLHTLAAAVDEKSTDEMKPFVCELYVRAITAGMNELERLKMKTEKEAEARAAAETLSSWFTQLGALLSRSARLAAECALTAFSVHPAPPLHARIVAAPALPPALPAARTESQESTLEANSEFGSWATDSCTKTNLVKTSETLNLKQTQHNANVLSTAVLSEGEALGLGAELCQDLAVLLSGPRHKTLSWDMNREELLENCRTYMDRTHGGTRPLTTELKYLNLDPSSFQHLPEEEEDENNIYYGIEKGYEHLIEFQEPETIWQGETTDSIDTEESYSSCMFDMDTVPVRRKKKKSKHVRSTTDEESDPLSMLAEVQRIEKKKERPHSKERSKERIKSKSKTPDLNKEVTKEQNQVISETKDNKKEKKERKKKDKVYMESKAGSLSRLVGMKVSRIENVQPVIEKQISCEHLNYADERKLSITSINSDCSDNNVVFDGLYSMDEIRSPEKCIQSTESLSKIETFDGLKDIKSKAKNSTYAVHETFSEVSNGQSCASSSLGNLVLTPIAQNVTDTSCKDDSIECARSQVNEDVKQTIKKLIEFRKLKSKYSDEAKISNNSIIPDANQSSVQRDVCSTTKHYINNKEHRQMNSSISEVNSHVTQNKASVNTINPKSIEKKFLGKVVSGLALYTSSLSKEELKPVAQCKSQSVSHESSKKKFCEPIRVQNMPCFKPTHGGLENKSNNKQIIVQNMPSNKSTNESFTNKNNNKHMIVQNMPCNKPTFETIANKNSSKHIGEHIIVQKMVNIKPSNESLTNKSNNKQIGEHILVQNMPCNKPTNESFAKKNNYKHISEHIKVQNMPSKMPTNESCINNSNNKHIGEPIVVQNMPCNKRINEDFPNTSNFQDFLKELQETINAGAIKDTTESQDTLSQSTVDQGVTRSPLSKTVTLNSNNRIKIRPASLSQSPKPTGQLKKGENAPNTFARLSYMHRNKQGELRNKSTISQTKQNQQPKQQVCPELEQKIYEFKLHKFNYLQTKGDITISRVGNHTQSKQSLKDADEMLIKNEKPVRRKQSSNFSVLLNESNVPNSHTDPCKGLTKDVQRGKSQTSIETSSKSFLAEKDQHDLLLLLQQQSRLNAPRSLLKSESKLKIATSVLPESSVENSANFSSNSNSSDLNQTMLVNSSKPSGCNDSKNLTSSYPLIPQNDPIKPSYKKAPTKKVNDTSIHSLSKNTTLSNLSTSTKSTQRHSLENNSEKQDWESVMDALLKHKTPSRGPNALDMALNRDSFEKRLKKDMQNKKTKRPISENRERVEIKKEPGINQQTTINTPKSASKSHLFEVVHTKTELPKRFNDKEILNETNQISKLVSTVKSNKETAYQTTKEAGNRNKKQSVIKISKSVSKTSLNDLNPFKPTQTNFSKRLKETEFVHKFNHTPKETSTPNSKNDTTCEVIKNNDPFISGIPNSDYDLLEELMDDDLRQEIGELLSDEDTFHTLNQDNTITGPIENKSSIDVNAKNMSVTQLHQKYLNGSQGLLKTHEIPKQIVQPSVSKCSYSPEYTKDIIKSPNSSTILASNSIFCNNNVSKSCGILQNSAKKTLCNPHTTVIQPTKNVVYTPVQEENIFHNNNIGSDQMNTTENSNILSKPEPIAVITQETDTSAKTCNNAMRKINNIDERKILFAAVPQRTTLQNVLLIGSDIVYDPYPEIQLQGASDINMCNVNSNTYVSLNTVQNIALLQTTQYAAPVVRPVIIGNAVTTSVVKNNVPKQLDDLTRPMEQVVVEPFDNSEATSNCPTSILEHEMRFNDKTFHKFGNSECKKVINKKNDVLTTVNKIETNSNKINERKILSQVQDNLKLPTERTDSNDDVKFKVSKNQDRLEQKRMAIISRKVNHHTNILPIPLPYMPLNKVKSKHKLFEHECNKEKKKLKNKNLEVSSHSCVNSSSGDKTLSNIICPDDSLTLNVYENSTSGPSSDDLRNTLQGPENCKENKSTIKVPCRRIMLRSSNKIKDKVILNHNPIFLKSTKMKVKLKDKVASSFENKETCESKINDDLTNEKDTCEKIFNKNKNAKEDSRDKGENKIVKGGIEKSEVNIFSKTDNDIICKNEDAHLIDIEDQLVGSVIPKINKILKEEDKVISIIDKKPTDMLDTTVKLGHDQPEENGLKFNLHTLKRRIGESLSNNENHHLRSDTGPVIVNQKISHKDDSIEQVNFDEIKNNEEKVLKKSKSCDKIEDAVNEVKEVGGTHEVNDKLKNSEGSITTKNLANIQKDNLREDCRDGCTPDVEKNSFKKVKGKKICDNLNLENVVFEEIPNKHVLNPLRKTFRVQLPNGKRFKATITGKNNFDIKTMLNSELKSILINNYCKMRRCTLNIRKVSSGKDSKTTFKASDVSTHNVNCINNVEDMETVNLISDDESESSHRLKTEHGDFFIASLDKDSIEKHKKKLSEKCSVVLTKYTIEQIFALSNNCNWKENYASRKEINLLSIESPMDDVFYGADMPINKDSIIVPEEVKTDIALAKTSVDSVVVNKLVIDLNEEQKDIEFVVKDLDYISINNKLEDQSLDKVLEADKLDIHNENIEPEFTHDCSGSAYNVPESGSTMECSLKITRCDDLVKRYEKLKAKSKKCFIKLVRCDDIINKYVNDDTSTYTTENIYNNNVDKDRSPEFNDEVSDIHNVNHIEKICVGSSLIRSDSFSILNDYSMYKENTDLVYELKNTVNYSSFQCDAEWFLSKRNFFLHALQYSSKYIYNNQNAEYCDYRNNGDISTDFESDTECFVFEEDNDLKKDCNDSKFEIPKILAVPSLRNLMVNYFETNSFLGDLKPVATYHKTMSQSNSNLLKRKQISDDNRSSFSKILKLDSKEPFDNIEAISLPSKSSIDPDHNLPESSLQSSKVHFEDSGISSLEVIGVPPKFDKNIVIEYSKNTARKMYESISEGSESSGKNQFLNTGIVNGTLTHNKILDPFNYIVPTDQYEDQEHNKVSLNITNDVDDSQYVNKEDCTILDDSTEIKHQLCISYTTPDIEKIAEITLKCPQDSQSEHKVDESTINNDNDTIQNVISKSCDDSQTKLDSRNMNANIEKFQIKDILLNRIKDSNNIYQQNYCEKKTITETEIANKVKYVCDELNTENKKCDSLESYNNAEDEKCEFVEGFSDKLHKSQMPSSVLSFNEEHKGIGDDLLNNHSEVIHNSFNIENQNKTENVSLETNDKANNETCCFLETTGNIFQNKEDDDQLHYNRKDTSENGYPCIEVDRDIAVINDEQARPEMSQANYYSKDEVENVVESNDKSNSLLNVVIECRKSTKKSEINQEYEILGNLESSDLSEKKNTDESPYDVLRNVTLIYKDNTGVVLKGIEYEDPINGTCYMFPLEDNPVLPDEITNNSGFINETNEIQISNCDDSDTLNSVCKSNIEEKHNNVEEEENLTVLIPKRTYSNNDKVIGNRLRDNEEKMGKRGVKRKSDACCITSKTSEKRYRKSKNIDYLKPSIATQHGSDYSKEFRRLFDYYNSLKFSYSRPFHKENIDVINMVKSWPIQESNEILPDTEFEDIFSDNSVQTCLQDPLKQTLVEEISTEYAETRSLSNEINETNFNMGFGEESGRVIQNLEKKDNYPKISAATLPDVKQSQPFLLSEDYKDCKNYTGVSNKFESTTESQKEKLKQYITYLQLRDKVRSFFKKTSLELKYNWMSDNVKDKDYKWKIDRKFDSTDILFDFYIPDFIEPPPLETIVQVVQVGQLPVSAAAQNPVSCDPRVTHVSNASPSQCSVENSPQDDSQSAIKTEYTELTTADISLPLVGEYEQHNENSTVDSSEITNLPINDDNLQSEKDKMSNEKDDPVIESSEIKEDKNLAEDKELQMLVNKHINNSEYPYDIHNMNTGSLESEKGVMHLFEPSNKQNSVSEKTDQIAHAMNAAGITTTSEQNSRAHSLVNILSQKIRQSAANTTQSSPSSFSKTASINAVALQQALAQILPPPLNQTSTTENNHQNQNAAVTPQVLHIIQGKGGTGNQLTLVDNNQQSVINTPNNTPVLHIVQNKTSPGTNPNGTPVQHANSFGGLSLVDTGLQQGGNQLLHIVNTGSQKNNSNQLLKRVNLLTNLTNVQGSNEQKMVQFLCKSADGKAIQLNAPHQRGMVLRLQPIESSNVQSSPSKTDDLSPTSTTNTASTKESVTTQQEIKSRSIYEENYAKFIQNTSHKQCSPEKSTSLPKFNQAFGKPVFQDGNQKQNEINSNNSNLSSINSTADNPECENSDNAINLDHIGQINSPPLLLRKSPQTSQAQSNLVQQIKQTIAPMNIQTMHGGVIYTRQIPVNIGGGQTINLITVPSTDLMEDSSQKQSDVKFVNQGDIEPSIIKIVPQNQTVNNEVSEEGNNHVGVSNENAQNPQTQPVLTQMRIKLPMLSKTPQMVSGARVVRPSFFQIQRNVIGGANQPVYQQLVLTAAPPLGQQTIRLPQSQPNRQIKVPTETQSSPESQMSSSTLEQLREFDMVLEQVKERSTVQPNSNANNSFSKLHTSSSDVTDGASTGSPPKEQAQVLYSIGTNQNFNVAYVNRKSTVTTPVTSSFVRSPDSSGITDSPTSSSHGQITQTVTTDTSPVDTPAQQNHHKPAKVTSKSKSRPKASSNPPNTLKLNNVPPKTSTQKPQEDEQTTQRILYILAEYKEQVENSPDKDKPAPRRRSNPPLNPSGSSKRKKSSKRSGGRDMSPVHGDETCRTMGSEDSSCGTSQGDCNESCLETHSPQDSPRKTVRKLTFEQETPLAQPRPQPQRNVIVADGQTITVARGTAGKPTTAVLMPANYILPVSMVKGGQQIAIVTNRGPKLLTVGGGEGGTTNALLLQRLIGPAGLKPVLTRPGVRHVRLPTAALHNLQAFNLATATAVQPPDSTASPAPAPTPPELIESRASASPWAERETQDVKPERGSSPEGSEPWNLASSVDHHDYTYEETVRADSMDRTVLVVHKKDGTSHRQHRLTHVSAAALRHKYAILEHELRLQKSLSEECEDLGVDSPSASELFPEAELLFAGSPAHDNTQDQNSHHSHTPQPTLLCQSGIPQPDLDDQIATDQLLPRNDLHDEHHDLDVNLGLEDVGIVTVSEDGMQATIALDQEEFARSHPNTTFHSEPTEDGEVQPFTIAGLKGRHITSTIFHSNRAPATVLMTAPQTTVISQATPDNNIQHNVKFTHIDSIINSSPSTIGNSINLSSVLVKDDGLTRFDSILTDSRELHLSNTASAIIHSSNNATQVIRRVCYDDDKRDPRFLIDEPDTIIAGDDAKMIAEDSSRDATLESIAGDVDDDRSSPERHAELFWESNSTSERSESRRPLDFSSDSDKCCKSPSYDETNSTDSSGVGTHMRLDSVIKDARGIERSASADCSSADDTHPPLRTYPPKRLYHSPEAEMERSLSGKTRAGERSPDSLEVRRRASGRGVVKRGCHCCNGSPLPPRPKKPRQRKPTMDFTTS